MGHNNTLWKKGGLNRPTAVTDLLGEMMNLGTKDSAVLLAAGAGPERHHVPKPSSAQSAQATLSDIAIGHDSLRHRARYGFMPFY